MGSTLRNEKQQTDAPDFLHSVVVEMCEYPVCEQRSVLINEEFLTSIDIDQHRDDVRTPAG